MAGTELGKAWVQIVPSADGISGSIRKALDPEATAAGKSAGNKISGALKKTMAAGAAAVGAATVATGALVKKSVESFAEYEQLAGGVEKIFDQANISKIMADANSAYKDLNMSANQYLTSINQTGAAFAQTMGDQKGYDIARTGMKAIADYSSGTGRNLDELNEKYALITRSTSSYQSIADQFSGILPATSKDFLEQAQAAGILSDSYSSLTDVPIAEYQEAVTKMLEKGVTDMGLYGNTAKESTETISGSLAMTKSAWENLVAGFANPDADIGSLVQNLMASIMGSTDEAGNHVKGLVDNIVPAIMQAFSGLGTAMSTVLPQLMSQIPALIQNIGLPLIQSGGQLVASLVQGLITALPQLVEVVTGLLGTLTESIKNNFSEKLNEGLDIALVLSEKIRKGAGKLISSGMQLLMSIASGIAKSMPHIIETIPTIISNIAGVINDNAPKLLATGVKIIATLAMGLVKAIPTIIANIPQILKAIWDAFTAFNWLALGGKLITAIGNGVKSLGGSFVAWFKNIGTNALKAFTKIDWKSAGVKAIKFIFNAIKGLATLPGRALKAAASAGMRLFTGVAWGNVGRQVLSKIASGITAAISTVTAAVKKIIRKIKDFFPFDVGKIFSGWIPKISLKTNKKDDSASTESSVEKTKFAKAMSQPYVFKRPTNFMAGEVGDEVLFGRSNLLHDMKAAVGGSSGDIIINLNYSAGEDANELARDIARGINRYRMAGAI